MPGTLKKNKRWSPVWLSRPLLLAVVLRQAGVSVRMEGTCCPSRQALEESSAGRAPWVPAQPRAGGTCSACPSLPHPHP